MYWAIVLKFEFRIFCMRECAILCHKALDHFPFKNIDKWSDCKRWDEQWLDGSSLVFCCYFGANWQSFFSDRCEIVSCFIFSSSS